MSEVGRVCLLVQLQHRRNTRNAELVNNTTQRITTQRNATHQTQHNGSQHNATEWKTTQQNSPQHNKTGNKNREHVLNKPVEVTSSSTENSTKKKTVKKRCKYISVKQIYHKHSWLLIPNTSYLSELPLVG